MEMLNSSLLFDHVACPTPLNTLVYRHFKRPELGHVALTSNLDEDTVNAEPTRRHAQLAPYPKLETKKWDHHVEADMTATDFVKLP